MHESVFAKQMLDARMHGGVTARAVVRDNVRRYLFLTSGLGIPAILLAGTDVWPVSLLLCGLLVGSLLRDVGWIIQSRKVWPFLERIIDWQFVVTLAQTDNAPEQKRQRA